MTVHAADVSTAAVPKRSTAKALAVLGGVQFVMILTMSMLSACLTSIQESLHTQTPTLSLLTAAYGMSFAGLLLLAGAVVDLGRARRVLAIALIVFVFGSSVSAAAPTTAVLLAGRVLQGAGAAFAVPAALALVPVVYPDPSTRGRAMALWGVLSGLGGISGLLYGGLVGTATGWRTTFVLPVVLAAAALILLRRIIPDTHAECDGSVDYVGGGAATAALGAASYALVSGPEYGWTSPGVIATAVTAVVAALVGVISEIRASAPLVPVELLRSADRVLALVTVFLASTAVTTVYFMLALHYQQVLGWNELRTALGFLPIGLVLFAASLGTNRLIGRVGPAAALPIGTGITAAGLWLTGSAIGSGSFPSLLPGLLVLPVGIALMFAASSVVGMSGIDDSKAGRGGALLNAVMEAGPAFGLAAIVSGATVITAGRSSGSTVTASDTSHGFSLALQVSGSAYAGVALLTAVVLAVPGWRSKKGTQL